MRTKLFRSFCWLSMVFLCPFITQAQAPSNLVVAQYHFAGSALFSSDTNFAKINQISALPATEEFRSAALKKIATFLAKGLSPQADPAKTSPFVQPLLSDLLQTESVANFGGRAGVPLSYALALKTDDRRAKLWESNLTQICAVQPQKLASGDSTGLQWGTGPRAIRLFRAKDWLVISGGDDLLPTQTQFLTSLRQQGRPAPALQGNFLEADVDWARLAQWIPALSASPFKLARTQVAISDKADNLKTTLHVHYPETLAWKSQPWRIPTEFIRDPIVSFTALQGFSAVLKPNTAFSQFQPNPLSQEFFVWAMADIPFQTSAAMPVNGAANLLKSYSTQVPASFNAWLKETHYGEIKWVPEHQQLTWQGLPMVVPFVEAAKTNSGEYLLAGLFPLPRGGKPVPNELFSQVDKRNNLIYYDWELTGPRLEQWRHLTQMLPILHPSLPKKTPVVAQPPAPTAPTAQKPQAGKSPRVAREAWLSAVSPLLGNTITEVTLTGPSEVTVQRKSHIGFTGIELVLLSQWLIEN